MSTPPPKDYYAIPCTPNYCHYAEEWHKAIAGDIHSPSDRDNVQITEARWYKESSSLEHECLVFTLNVKQLGKPQAEYRAFISVERLGVQETINAALREENIPLQVLPDRVVESMDETERRTVAEQIFVRLREEVGLILTRAERSNTRLKNLSKAISNQPTIAIDLISRVRAKQESEVIKNLTMKNPELLETFLFESGTFPLRDLGIMLHEIQKVHPAFTLKKYNCYWLSWTLTQVLIRMKNPTRTSPGIVDERAGYLMRYQVVKPDPAEVEFLVDTIRTGITVNDQFIKQEWEAGKGGKAESDARLAASEEARVRERQENEATLVQERREKERLARELQEKERLAASREEHIKRLEEELQKSQP